MSEENKIEIKLPSVKEVAIAIAEGEKMIVDELNNLKGKIEGLSPEMLKTVIDI